MTTKLPLAVLGDALVEAIDGRPVRTAVFTTYSFDPGFFELHILPLLFDQAFAQVEKIRRIQLEHLLRSTDVAVYYDRSALAQEALPAQLDVRRIDVRRGTGAFHPKVVLLLVDDPLEPEGDDEEEPTLPSLIVGALSANLTRAGWWENVETGHFEEISHKELVDKPSPFRGDLLKLIHRIRQTAAAGEQHAALDAIHAFLLHGAATGQTGRRRTGGRYRNRLFMGQKSLPDWLWDLKLRHQAWNLEVISPFFDGKNARTLKALIAAIKPRETRVYLPRDADGGARVSQELYHAIAKCAHWGHLPASLAKGGSRARDQKAPPRRVHAKVYRLWHRDGPQLVLTGSVNLTAAAHSHGAAGNLETAFLVDVTDGGISRQWWLECVHTDPQAYAEHEPTEEDDEQEVCVDVSFRYDWSANELYYRIEHAAKGSLRIQEASGRDLFVIDTPRPDKWIDCGATAADKVRELLPSTSFLRVRHAKETWRVLVREEGMAHRPSLQSALTPEEILRHWSLLNRVELPHCP